MQIRLIEANYLDDKADGSFGGKTEAAIKRAQDDAGLEPTGVYDADIHAYLQNHRTNFVTDKAYELTLYALRMSASNTLEILVKNTGHNPVTSFEFTLAQCDESKQVLGDFFGHKGGPEISMYLDDLSLMSGECWKTDVDLSRGRKYATEEGSSNTVTYFDDGRYARVTLIYFTADGTERSTSQTLYCRFR